MKTTRIFHNIPAVFAVSLFAAFGDDTAPKAEATNAPESDPFADKAESFEQAQPKPKYHGNEELAKIVLFPATEAPKAGLKVEILEPVVWTSDTHATFTYRITNCLDDEVFVEVQDLHKVGTDYEGPEGSAGGGIGSGIGWPHNRILLKRLPSGGCCCSTVEVKASTDVPFFASDKGKTTVTIMVSGFLRSTGKQFIDSIEIPFAPKKKTKK